MKSKDSDKSKKEFESMQSEAELWKRQWYALAAESASRLSADMRKRVIQQYRAEKAGKAPKSRPWPSVAETIVGSDATVTGITAWECLPDEFNALMVNDDLGRSWECYRDGNKAVAILDKDGRERVIKYDTFRKHINTAVKNIC